MADLPSERPRIRDWLSPDGAAGTNLLAMGASGAAPEPWSLGAPGKTRAPRRRLVELGSDPVLANVFSGTAFRLALHGGQDRIFGIDRRPAKLAPGCAAAA